MIGNGAIVGDGTLGIDYWYKDQTSPLLYFLTHLHADHIDGLTKAWSSPIYTSELNCQLAPLFIPGIRKSLLKPLPLNEEIAIPLFR